ncbi:VOC family protein [Rhodococcus sp. NPDC058514]|uniref:VOC family protein n=1 Tax=unclassified Rhodococcus (in: high G+C Gram-positive bacteria) TaxID=192944 RepID=UPI00365307F0
MADRSDPDPEQSVVPRPAALPYLSVPDARRAIEWYTEVFGARVDGEPIMMPDDRVGHCELVIGDGTLYLADEFPEIGFTAPVAGHSGVSLMLPVADTDAALERARAAGARVEREPTDENGQRGATLVDPFGHRWMLAGPIG